MQPRKLKGCGQWYKKAYAGIDDMKQGSLPRHGASNRSNPSTSTEIQEMMKRAQRALTKGSSLNFRFTFFTSQDVFLDFVFPSDLPRLREFAAFQDLKKLFCLSIPQYLHGEMCSFALMINMIVMLMVLGLSSNAFKCWERERKRGKKAAQCVKTSQLQVEPLVHCLGSTEALRCFWCTLPTTNAFALWLWCQGHVVTCTVSIMHDGFSFCNQKYNAALDLWQRCWCKCNKCKWQMPGHDRVYLWSLDRWNEYLVTRKESLLETAISDRMFAHWTGLTYAVCLVAGIFLRLGRLIDTQRHRKILQCTIFLSRLYFPPVSCQVLYLGFGDRQHLDWALWIPGPVLARLQAGLC